jgi:uncharacterized protein (DUF2236 family)
MKYFVEEHSIVRRIWGNGDTILFIFAGASAEFALNKAVDWLYFTGRLPADPLGRLFSTVAYARAIVFSEEEAAHKAIDTIAAIHAAVEANRGAKIPDWAYRDVLFMLIDYSIRSYEVLERKLSYREKEEVFDVFYRVGCRMGLKDLPKTFAEWQHMREGHLRENMQYSYYTDDLYRQYRKHLGLMRYRLLLETQRLIVPPKVRQLLGPKQNLLLKPLLSLYKILRYVRLDRVMKELILPQNYKQQIKSLDVRPQH